MAHTFAKCKVFQWSASHKELTNEVHLHDKDASSAFSIQLVCAGNQCESKAIQSKAIPILFYHIVPGLVIYLKIVLVVIDNMFGVWKISYIDFGLKHAQ